MAESVSSILVTGLEQSSVYTAGPPTRIECVTYSKNGYVDKLGINFPLENKTVVGAVRGKKIKMKKG